MVMVASRFRQRLERVLLKFPYRYTRFFFNAKQKYDYVRAFLQPSKNKPFCLVGSQRSGTTMLCLILNSHPNLRVYDEDVAYDIIRSDKYRSEGLVGFKIPIWTQRYKFMKKKYPYAKYIFLQRDTKSVVASMLALGWIKNYGKGEYWTSYGAISDTITKRVFSDAYKEFEKNKDEIILATLVALIKSYMIIEYRKNDLNVLEVWYESLVSKPELEINKVLDFLGVDWNREVLRHHEAHSGIWAGRTDASRPIDIESVNKWEKRLTEEQVKTVEKFQSIVGAKNWTDY